MAWIYSQNFIVFDSYCVSDMRSLVLCQRRMHKSRVPGCHVNRILYSATWYSWFFSIEGDLCHHSGGTKNFEVAPSFSENLCTTVVNSDGTQKPSVGLNLSSYRITDSRLCINVFIVSKPVFTKLWFTLKFSDEIFVHIFFVGHVLCVLSILSFLIESSKQDIMLHVTIWIVWMIWTMLLSFYSST